MILVNFNNSNTSRYTLLLDKLEFNNKKFYYIKINNSDLNIIDFEDIIINIKNYYNSDFFVYLITNDDKQSDILLTVDFFYSIKEEQINLNSFFFNKFKFEIKLIKNNNELYTILNWLLLKNKNKLSLIKFNIIAENEYYNLINSNILNVIFFLFDNLNRNDLSKLNNLSLYLEIDKDLINTFKLTYNDYIECNSYTKHKNKIEYSTDDFINILKNNNIEFKFKIKIFNILISDIDFYNFIFFFLFFKKNLKKNS